MTAIHPVCESQIPAAVKLAAELRSEGALATLIVPWDPNTLSANKCGRHWGAHVPAKDDARICASWAWTAAGEPQLKVPVSASLLVFRVRAMDDENCLVGLKACRDEWIRLGLLPDDSPRWWAWTGIEWVAGAAWNRSGVTQPWSVIVLRERAEK